MQLSVMMFLQFFIWGAWLPQSFGYWEGVLGFTPGQAMMLDMAFPISAILAMFFANQFADRNFAAEKFLAFSHLIGGVALLAFGFLAFLRLYGGSLFVLCAYDECDQYDFVRCCNQSPKGLWPDSFVGYHRLDRCRLALHFHFDRLG
jgi:hypothetical protein